MAYSAVPEVNTSDQWSASDHNTYIKDNFAYFKSVTDSLLAGTKPVEGRLTLESGVPVPSTDQADKTTLYYTPYVGNTIALYNGTSWDLVTFAELSLDISGFTASKPYDIFVYNNSGTATLEGLVWTNASTRATALAYQDGVLVKDGATTRRYIGTIYIDADSKCDDSEIARLVWNMYNRAPRLLEETEGTLHNYNGASRLWGNSTTNNLIKWVIGQNVVSDIHCCGTIASGATGNYAYIHTVVDGSADNRAQIQNYILQYIEAGNDAKKLLASGYHYASMYEASNHALSAFANMLFSVEFVG